VTCATEPCADVSSYSLTGGCIVQRFPDQQSGRRIASDDGLKKGARAEAGAKKKEQKR
jgi:hypothetical protein